VRLRRSYLQVTRDLIARLVAGRFDLRPAAFRRDLDLHRPIYSLTSAYGHFGRTDADLPWERTDRAAELREAAGLPATPARARPRSAERLEWPEWPEWPVRSAAWSR
jgi:hypothetical protein